MDERTVGTCFLVIPFDESVYNVILGRPFFAALDAVASTIHLKMKYHNDFGKPVIIWGVLRGSPKIHEAILKNPWATMVGNDKRKKQSRGTTVSMVHLKVREVETIHDDELESSLRLKEKTLTPIPGENI